MIAQLQIIPYKSLKTFLKITWLNYSISVCTNGGTAFRFWHYLYELDSFFVTPCNEVAKYFYTAAHL